MTKLKPPKSFKKEESSALSRQEQTKAIELTAEPMVEPRAMTVMQIASALNLSRSKAYELARSEGFPKIRLGKRLLIPKEAFADWMQKNTKLTYDVWG